MDYGSVMEPAYPSIAVHKGWFQPRKGRMANSDDVREHRKTQEVAEDLTTLPMAGPAVRRQYEFVNATNPCQTKDESCRRTVRTHVRNEYLRNKRKCEHSVEQKALSQIECNGRDGGTDVPILLGYPTALCMAEYAFEMKPRMHAILSQYLTFVGQKTWPGSQCLRPNPLKSPVWFGLAVKDPAMLHAMLYSAALCLALLEGRIESHDSIYHLYQTISVVNERLKTSTQNIEETTIGAMSCLALGEAITGNREAWIIHMRGLKQILQIKNRSTLSHILTGKLHRQGNTVYYVITDKTLTRMNRTDIAGAIDYSETPHLDFIRSEAQFTWSTLPRMELERSERNITRILSSCHIDATLIAIMIDVAHFSKAVLFWRSKPSLVININSLPEDMYWIEYRLLLFLQTPASSIDEACRLGALLYMKALLEEFPHSVTGSSVLLERLQKSIEDISVIGLLLPLVHWLSLIGASLSKSKLRAWFIELLERTTLECQNAYLRDCSLEFNEAISLDEVLGRSLERVRLEVEERRWEPPSPALS